MAYSSSIMTQLLKHIPRHDFQSCVNQYGGDKKIRQLSCWTQFVSMLFGQITLRKSLRDLGSSLKSKRSFLYYWGTKPVHFSTLARANEKRAHAIYESFFNKLYRKTLSTPRSHGFRFKNLLYALDATTIDLCLSLFSWASFRSTKAGVKLHTLLNLQGNIPEFVAITPAKTQEVRVAHDLNLPPGSIITMDRGYEDYSLYQNLDDKGVFFVTRLKKCSVFKTVERRKTNKHNGLLADHTIRFTGYYAKQDCRIPLRTIVFKDPETGKRLVFITNIFHLSALTITNIYKARWKVELFFRWIKQNLRIKSFFGTSENAVKTQIYIALIAYLIIFWLKHLSRSILSMMQLTRLLQLSLTAKGDLTELLNPNFKPPDALNLKNQLCFNNF